MLIDIINFFLNYPVIPAFLTIAIFAAFVALYALPRLK
jgi:hypothetical protein